jgi:hypothetical protein
VIGKSLGRLSANLTLGLLPACPSYGENPCRWLRASRKFPDQVQDGLRLELLNEPTFLGLQKPLLNRWGRGQRHAMTVEDLRHFRAIGRAAGGNVDYFGGLAEVRRPHYRRGYDGELFHILVA